MTSDYSLLSNRQIVALTIFGEARGEPIEGQIAVGCVIRNRVKGAGFPSWSSVCLKPSAFSCFNPDSPERPAMLSGAQALSNESGVLSDGLRQALWIADGIIGGALLDNTHQANHYLRKDLYTLNPPGWAVGVPTTAIIGQHAFLVAA